eukprot:795253-Pleurochrysis_carterae.AAC.1
MRSELLRSGEIALSVDLRESQHPGAHDVGDFEPLLNLTSWKRVFAWPPCTHQTTSNTTHAHQKRRDGRAFWGIALVLRCLCADADCVVVEQPDTIIPAATGIAPTVRFRPSDFGDNSSKPINLFIRGCRAPFFEPLTRTPPARAYGRLPTQTSETCSGARGT